MTAEILEKIDFELRETAGDPKNIKDYSRFHKDGKIHISIATPILRKIASKYFKEIKRFTKQQIFSLCTNMLDAGKAGYRELAFDWAFRMKKWYQSDDFVILEGWLENHVDNWGSCDDLSCRAFGEFILRFPEFLPRLKRWAKSPNKWLRRASAVVLIYSLRRNKYLKDALNIAKILFSDPEDLVQKGYGWMLKEAGSRHQDEVANFVTANKKAMTRTALRYAVENFPQVLKAKAMAK